MKMTWPASVALLFAATTHATSNFSAAIFLPQGLVGSITTNTPNASWKLRTSVGGWPIERAWPGELAIESDLGPTYQSIAAPRIFLVTSSLAAVRVPSYGGSFGWAFGFDLLLIHAGALVFIENKETNSTALAAELDGKWWQPSLSAQGEWIFQRSERGIWALSFGILVPFGGGLSMNTRGPLPSLQAVAPEFSDAIVDGTRAAEENLSSLLRDKISSLPVWPTIGIQYTWH